MQRVLHLNAEARLLYGVKGGAEWTDLGLVDCANSDFALAQDMELLTDTLPGVHGERRNGARFLARGMSIVLVSDDGLTANEKRRRADLVRQLYAASVKGELLYLDSYHFPAPRWRYVQLCGGMDDPKQEAGWFSVAIPLKALDPLWYSEQTQGSMGITTVMVGGSTTCWPVFKAVSGAVGPYGGMGNFSFRYAGTVPEGVTLVVDTKRMDGYFVNAWGTRSEVPLEWNIAGFEGCEPGPVTVNTGEGVTVEWMEAWV